jgi:hypothetical protein
MLPEGDSVSSYHIFIQLSHHRRMSRRQKKKEGEKKKFLQSTLLSSLGISHPHTEISDYVIPIFTESSSLIRKNSISNLRISHKDKYRRSQPAFLLFLFLFFLRAATQLLFHPCCLDINSRDVIPGVSCVTERRNCTPVLLYWSF